MKYNKTLTTLAAAAGLLAAAGTASAATIVNYNFSNIDQSASLTGPAGGSGETWDFSGNYADTDILDSTGAATTIDWTMTGSLNKWGHTGNGNAENLALLQRGIYSSGTVSLTFAGLTDSSTYDVYLAGGTSFENFTTTTTTTNDTTTVGAQVLAHTGNPTSWIEGTTHVLFENVETDGFGNIVFSIAKNSGQFGFYSGFQLVETAAVPEPSAFALLAGMFGLTWVMLRRRA
jgi:hypothetical protein